MYVRELVERVISSGGRPVVLLSHAAITSDEYNLHLGQLQNVFELETSGSITLAHIRSTAARHDVVLTALLEADSFRAQVAVSGWRIGRLSMLVMRPDSQKLTLLQLPMLRKFVKTLLRKGASIRNNVTVLTLVSGTSEVVHRSEVRDPISVTGTAQERAAIAKRFGIGDGRKWFGVVGAISARKNPQLILRAACTALDSTAGVILAGRIDSSVDGVDLAASCDELRAKGIAVRIVDRLLEDIEVDGLLANLHCVVLAHSNEGSSGILGKASALGTLVLAAGAASLRRDVSNLDGALWVALQDEDLADGLSAMAKEVSRTKQEPVLDVADGLEKLITVGAERGR